MNYVKTPVSAGELGSVFDADGEPIFWGAAPKGRLLWQEQLLLMAERSDEIVRAVNAHVAMVDALEELLGNYNGGADSALDDEYVVGRACAALALAKGES